LLDARDFGLLGEFLNVSEPRALLDHLTPQLPFAPVAPPKNLRRGRAQRHTHTHTQIKKKVVMVINVERGERRIELTFPS